MGRVASNMGLELPSLRLLSRDLRSVFLVLELKSVTILTPLSMATESLLRVPPRCFREGLAQIRPPEPVALS